MIHIALQLFGGRGSSGGKGGGGGTGSRDGTLENVKPRTITTTYHSANYRSNGYYRDSVLEATTDGNGNLTFDFASWKHEAPSAKTNKTHAATTTITHGAINGELVGVDLSKAKSVQGNTYEIRNAIKSHGFRWDGKGKRWYK